MQTPTKELFNEGTDYMVKKNMPDSALFCFYVITSRYTKDMDKSEQDKCCAAFNNSGFLYLYYYYDYINALNNYLQALEICDNPKLQASISLNIGTIYCYYAQYYTNAQNFAKALEYFKKAYYLAIEQQSWRTVLIAFDNLWNLGFSKSIINANKKELERFATLPIPESYPMKKFSTCLYKAICHIKNGQYSKAQEQFRKQFKCIQTEVSWESYECQTYWNIVYVYKLTNESDSVLYYAQKLKDKAQLYQLKDFQVQAYDLLSEYYRNRQMYNESTRYRLLYFQKRDSLLNYHKLNNVTSEFLLHDLKKVSTEVKELNQKRHTQNIIITICLFGSAIITFLLVTVFRKNKQLNFRNEVLYQKNVEIIASEEEHLKQRKIMEEQLLVFQRDIGQEDVENKKKKYQNTNLDETFKIDLLEKIQTVMENVDEICSVDFSSERLAILVDSKYKYVSQVINEKYNKSFALLLSEYRVKEACKRLNDINKYGNLTIEGIGASVGFKAHSGFFLAFKRVTGLSPSEYLKIAKSKHK